MLDELLVKFNMSQGTRQLLFLLIFNTHSRQSNACFDSCWKVSTTCTKATSSTGTTNDIEMMF